MRRTIAILGAATLLALNATGIRAEASESLTPEMIENANTPAEHQAVARYYREKAAEAKATAERHSKMAKSVFAGKPKVRDIMKSHCERVAKLNADLAAQYEAIAKEQEAASQPD